VILLFDLATKSTYLNTFKKVMPWFYNISLSVPLFFVGNNYKKMADNSKGSINNIGSSAAIKAAINKDSLAKIQKKILFEYIQV
jgi:hypothetical protein